MQVNYHHCKFDCERNTQGISESNMCLEFSIGAMYTALEKDGESIEIISLNAQKLDFMYQLVFLLQSNTASRKVWLYYKIQKGCRLRAQMAVNWHFRNGAPFCTSSYNTQIIASGTSLHTKVIAIGIVSRVGAKTTPAAAPWGDTHAPRQYNFIPTAVHVYRPMV